jgi:hypothetical protein
MFRFVDRICSPQWSSNGQRQIHAQADGSGAEEHAVLAEHSLLAQRQFGSWLPVDRTTRFPQQSRQRQCGSGSCRNLGPYFLEKLERFVQEEINGKRANLMRAQGAMARLGRNNGANLNPFVESQSTGQQVISTSN